MMVDAGIVFDPDKFPKLVQTLDGVPDDAEELTLGAPITGEAPREPYCCNHSSSI